MDVTGKYTPMELYEKGLYTLEEVIEMDPNITPEWIEEQERRIEAAWARFKAAERPWVEGL